MFKSISNTKYYSKAMGDVREDLLEKIAPLIIIGLIILLIAIVKFFSFATHFDSTDNGNGCTASKPMTGRTYPCVVTGKTYWLGFPHLYYPSNPTFAERFMRMADTYRLHKNIM